MGDGAAVYRSAVAGGVAPVMEQSMPGTARRAAEVRAADFEARGFRNIHIGLADARKHRGFPDGAVIVSGRAPCGRMIRAGLAGPMQGCGAGCKCVEG